jgi:hypothetical protein
MKAWPEVGVAATNVEIRIRQAWKPVPSPVPHQTRFNELVLKENGGKWQCSIKAVAGLVCL